MFSIIHLKKFSTTCLKKIFPPVEMGGKDFFYYTEPDGNKIFFPVSMERKKFFLNQSSLMDFH